MPPFPPVHCKHPTQPGNTQRCPSPQLRRTRFKRFRQPCDRCGDPRRCCPPRRPCRWTSRTPVQPSPPPRWSAGRQEGVWVNRQSRQNLSACVHSGFGGRNATAGKSARLQDAVGKEAIAHSTAHSFRNVRQRNLTCTCHRQSTHCKRWCDAIARPRSDAFSPAGGPRQCKHCNIAQIMRWLTQKWQCPAALRSHLQHAVNTCQSVRYCGNANDNALSPAGCPSQSTHC